MAGHEWEDWFEREEFIGQISDIRVQNLQVEREVVQKRTFTRWMNLHLEKCDPPIEVHDLFQDIQDGRILMALLEELSGCKLLHGFKKSSHRIFRLNNIAKVLSFLEERNVKLVSIDAADVADGNSSIILGLIWNIILFFQIKELTGNIRSQFPSTSSLSSIPTSSDSDASYCSTPSDERQSATTAMREHGKAIKKLLQWVQKRTRKYGVAVQDFGKSWTSGLAFLAVIKSIDSSLVDMRKALLRSARENLEDAFRIAHYSLGIPRLLEPEDVTINAPDEQSIMTYVSQFLEHFPGIEEPEDYCQLIERSVSMGRLNFRDTDLYRDSDHMRNGAHRGRVKERSYMFQKDSAQPPPKILISSISEDRSVASPRFKVAAARSWSSEDFLADSPHMEDTSSSVPTEPKEHASKISSNSTATSPQLSYTHSPTSSSVPESVNTESVIGDSAIGSPDSWVESEKFCESRSDSSLCDSGTAWDVYRATPVEVTPLDEGSIPSIEDQAPNDQSMTESYIDEGIYSLSSLESTQDRIQGHSEKRQVEVVKEKEANIENHNQDLAIEQVPDQCQTESAKKVDSEHVNASQKGKVPREQEPSSGLCDPEVLAKELLEQNSVEESREQKGAKTTVDLSLAAQNHKEQINAGSESLEKGNSSGTVQVETEFQKTDSSLDNSRNDSRSESEMSKEKNEGVASEVLLENAKKSQASNSAVTLENTHSANQEGASKASQSPSTDMNIPLISISSEPEGQDEEGTSEGLVHAEDEEALGQQKLPGRKETSKDVNSSQSPEASREDKTPVESPSCLASENVEPSNEHLDDTDKQNEKNLVAQFSSTTAETELVSTKQDLDSTNQCDGNQDKLAGTFSDSETTNTQQNNSKSNGKIKILCEASRVSRSMDFFYSDFGRSSPTEDVVGDPLEPMDLFYPDKEELTFPEPADTEMQSWPSVLSVSALEPAPASETLLDDQELNLLSQDFRNGGDLVQEQDEVHVITKTNLKTEDTSEEECLFPREKIGGGDVRADRSDLSEAEQQKPVSGRENTETVRSDTRGSGGQEENQIPTVLRHRKGPRFPESMDSRRVVPRKADSDDFDVWWSERGELYLLLLIWLLLYCYWVLPQMDLKTLPSLLLNR